MEKNRVHGSFRGTWKPVRPSDLVEAVLTSLRQREAFLPGTLADREVVLRKFASFAENALGIPDANGVTLEGAQRFVHAPRGDGSAPSDSDRHRRRGAVRLLYSEGRRLGLVSIDPARDISLGSRSSLLTRPLTDEEIELGRAWALNSLTNLRRPIAWALAEAGAWSTEITAARIEDIDFQNLRLWLRGTPTKDPRWGSLTGWGASQVERRLREASTLDPGGPLVTWRTAPRSGHAAGSQAVKETLRAAGLDQEPDVRPASLVGWRGRKLLEDGRDIAQVARALGYRSLDEAAAFIGFSWRPQNDR